MQWPDEIVEFKINKQLDPDSSQLSRLCEAQVAYKRMRATRFMLIHLLAFVGVVVWILAISPDLLPQRARHFTFIVWGSFLFLTISVVVEEYVLWRKLAGLLTPKGGLSYAKK